MFGLLGEFEPVDRSTERGALTLGDWEYDRDGEENDGVERSDRDGNDGSERSELDERGALKLGDSERLVLGDENEGVDRGAENEGVDRGAENEGVDRGAENDGLERDDPNDGEPPPMDRPLNDGRSEREKSPPGPRDTDALRAQVEEGITIATSAVASPRTRTTKW